MDKFVTHSGKVMPLRRSDVDTDQIIPAVYLKRVTRTGFEDGLFSAWRDDPSFVLNNPAHAGATILVAGPNFGTGSSRQHAVWALRDWGFKAVIAARFGDIFRGNALKEGLLPVQLDQKAVEALWDMADSEPEKQITVDLGARQVHGYLFFRLAVGHVPERLDGLLVELDGQQPLLERVPPEDIAEPGRDDRLEAPVAQRPDRVLPGRAGAEVGAGHQDRGAGVGRVVEHERRVVPPGAEQPVLETGAGDPLQVHRRDDLVGIHIGAAQGHDLAAVGDELVHLWSLPLQGG